MIENRIYTTSKYNDFILKEENRLVDERHVKKIAESMKNYGWIGSPIEVSEANGKFQIEDGQHRFMACEMTNTPVRFVVVRQRSAYEVASQNWLNKKWNQKDFIEMYSRNGNTNYKRLKNLMNEFPLFTLPEILMTLRKANGGNDHKMERGQLTITEDDYYNAKNILTELARVKEKFKEVGYPQRVYVNVVMALIRANAINIDKLIEKLDKYGKSILEPITTANSAIDYIERVYNYKTKTENVVGFKEAYIKDMRRRPSR